jgi:MinD-like ATPase involved in chromosome partitioning or flagellar assembly
VNRALPIVLANERSKFSRALAELASDVFKQPETERQQSKRRFIGGRR